MVLSEVDGKACFSILEDVSSWEGDNYVYRFREMLNYYPTQNEGQELGGRPGEDHEPLVGRWKYVSPRNVTSSSKWGYWPSLHGKSGLSSGALLER